MLEGREPEIWVDLTYPDVRPIYKISNYGRVKNINMNKILRPFYDKDGYLKFTLQRLDGTKIKCMDHRLVGHQFIPNPENKPEINHIRVVEKNGRNYCIKDDNYYKNLEWCTRQENLDHSIKHNLEHVAFGEKVFGNRFTVDFVYCICDMFEQGYNNLEVLDYITGIHNCPKNKYPELYALIHHLRHRNSWKFVTDQFDY